MRNYSLLISKKLYARNILVFLSFGLVFMSYHQGIRYGSLGMLIFLNASVLAMFLLTAFRPKLGLYVFIAFIPLINIVPNLMGFRELDILLFIFFGFFLGYLLSFFDKDFRNRLGFWPMNYYDRDILAVGLVFLGILVISMGVTVFRYANFHPFITNNYYDLKVNLYGYTSSNAIPWVIIHFFNYAIGFLFLFSAFNIIERRKEIIRSIIILVSATGLSSLYAAYQYFFNPTLGSTEQWAASGRINSTFTDPNALGAYSIIIFPIFFSMVIFTRRRSIKIVFSVLFALFVLMVFFSGSRVALLAIFLALAAFGVYGLARYIKYLSGAPSKKKIVNLAVILPLVLVVAVSSSAIFFTDNPIKESLVESEVFQRTAMSVDTFRHHFSELGFVEGLKSISNFRYFYWEMAANMAVEHPASGVGPGAYVIELPDYLHRFGTGFFIVDHTGNYYLQVLAELGFPGLIAMLFLFYLIIKKTSAYYAFKRKAGFSKKDDRLLMGILISLGIAFISLIFGPHTNFTSIALTFWLVIAFMLSSVKINQLGMSQRMDERKNIARPLSLSASPGFDWRQKISYSVILLTFFAGFMLSSYTSLSINYKQTVYEFENEYGFYQEFEEDGRNYRWTAQEASRVVQKRGESMVIPMRAPNPDIEEEPLGVRVYVDNSLMGSLWFEDDSWYDVIVDLSHIRRDAFTLTITCSRDWVQRDWDVGDSRRELGILLGQWYFK